MMSRHVAVFVFLLNTLLLLSCNLGVRFQSVMGIESKLYVDVRDSANEDTPIALDLVIVNNDELLKGLLNMTAGEWFKKRDQIKRDFIEGGSLNCMSWEWAPERRILEYSVQKVPKAKAIMIYANYNTIGEHRFRVDPFKNIKITLSENEFLVESID